MRPDDLALFPEVVAEETRCRERHASAMLKRAVPQAFALLAAVGSGYLRVNAEPLVRWVTEARRMLLAEEVDEAGAVRFVARALIIETYGTEEAEDRLEEARYFLERLARTL